MLYQRAGKYFYPRSPCGERHGTLRNTHKTSYFYPRSPCGERHSQDDGPSFSVHISIHALLAESDQLYDTYAKVLRVFLSTLSLRRATKSLLTSVVSSTGFLSTLSLRRATAKVHKTVGHFCAYETNFMGIASSC